jgi:CDGSH-type Zn-finger protein/uncharacterized Fe-S cluster protein YjdI
MSSKDVVEYQGDDAVVTWNGKLCIHIGECGRAKGDLFIGGRQPWCNPDLASNDEVEEVVERCPTGALSVTLAGGSYAETPDPDNTVQVAYNGPLFMRGELDIADAPDDVTGLQFRAALCRCGASKNKPFCDNSHEEIDFRDYGAVGESGDLQAAAGGKLSVTAAPDGPLLVKGNLSIYSSSGRDSWRGKQVALCRCGASENKPFCDGKHKAIGFKSGE